MRIILSLSVYVIFFCVGFCAGITGARQFEKGLFAPRS